MHISKRAVNNTHNKYMHTNTYTYKYKPKNCTHNTDYTSHRPCTSWSISMSGMSPYWSSSSSGS
jgi:hypothetical protein